MSKANSTARKRTLQLVLSDSQIETLVRQVCANGDDAEAHTRALLILADELMRGGARAEDMAYVIRKAAFSCLSDDVIDAQVQLLRSELKT